MQQFLNFVVENMLDGNLDRLKETVVGIEVFDRSPGYDPKSDSVVRTEARRLRSKLEEYYSNQGVSDSVIIRINKGGYVPVFELAEQLAPPQPVPEPSLAPEPPPLNAASIPLHARWRWPLYILITAGLVSFPVFWHFSPGATNHAPLRVVPLTGNSGAEINPSLSPDGRQIAYAWRKEGGNFDIYAKPIDAGDAMRLTTDDGHEISPSWSPDGQQIAFLRATPTKTEVAVMPALGGPEKVVLLLSGTLDKWQPYGTQNWGKSGPVWLKDGKKLIVSNTFQDEVYGLIKLDLNGEFTPLTEPRPEEIDFSPSVSPDGESIAFVRGIPGAGDIYIIPSGGGTPRRLTRDHTDISGVIWWDRETLLFSSRRGGNPGLWSIKIMPSAPAPTPFALGSGAESLTASSKASLVAYVTATEQESIWRRALRSPTVLAPAEKFISSSRRDNSPQYSPDGSHIAFVSDRSGSWEIWMCDADGSHTMQLTKFGGPPLGSPKWSPDGRSLAFDALVGPHSAIWILEAEANKAPRKFSQEDFEDLIPTWSRDGQWIYFLSKRSGSNKLWKRPVRGGPAVLVTPDSGLDATESEDGSALYYQHGQGGLWRKANEEIAGTPIPELVGVLPFRNWELTRGGIYLTASAGDGPPVLSFFKFVSKELLQLGQLDGEKVDGTPSLTVSPDGHWLLYAQREPRRSNIIVAHQAYLN